MKLNNSFINETFNNWNITLPQEEYFLEYLQREYPSNFYFIDQCPFSVDKKHNQIDMFFQEVLEKSLKKSEFEILENKYRNIMLKMWLYNAVYISTNVIEVNIKEKSKKIDRKYFAYYNDIMKKGSFDEHVAVEQREILELFVQLGTRDLIDVVFYLEDYKMIVSPLWSCYAVFFNDLSIKDTVEKIVNTEGMYLRKFNTKEE